MGLKNLVLALFVLACGGNTTGNSNDGSLECKINCSYDGGNNKKDGNISSDGCCKYDGSVDGKLDGSYDVNNNDGSVDSSVDGSIDSNVNNDGSADGPIDYPVAVLTCNEWAEDGLCIHRPVVSQEYCWDASGSLAGPGRVLVEYRMYPRSIDFPDFYIWAVSPENLCGSYEITGIFNAKLRVIDDLGDFNDQEFYNIVSEN